MKKYALILSLLGLITPLITNAQININGVIYKDKDTQIGIDSLVQVYEDTEKKITIGSLKDQKSTSYKDVLFDQNKFYWYSFKIKNQEEDTLILALEVGYVGEMRLYLDTTENYLQTGELVPKSQRQIDKYTEVFKLVIAPNDSIYCISQLISNPRIRASCSFQISNFNSWENEYIKSEYSRDKIPTYIFIGAVGFMVLYYLSSIYYFKDKQHIYYTLYMFCWLIFFLYTLNPVKYISEDYPLLKFIIQDSSLVLSFLFYFQFIRHFVNTKEEFPFWEIFFRILTAYFIFTLIIDNIVVYGYGLHIDIINTIDNISLIFQWLVIMIFMFRIILKNDIIKNYLVYGNLFLFLSIFIAIVFGIHNLILLESGVLGEMLFFSIGLSAKQRKIALEKLKFQQELLLKSKENEKLVAEQKETLEKKISERTLQLKAAYDELQVTNEELNQQHEEMITQREFIEKQNTELQSSNKKISSSIRAALVIQESILPFENRVKAFIKDYFVIYKPKDIVSGDFWWIDQFEDKIYLSCIDCTGHGVSGAFMTIIGYTILEKIIRVKGLRSPSEILEEMHSEVQEILKQKETKTNNGMDMSIMSIEKNKETIKICFSGAKHSLFYINQGDNGIVEVKGVRKAIGGIQNTEKRFVNDEIQIKPYSWIYLGSDGLADQNNPNRKRFGADKLKEILLKEHQNIGNVQKDIIETQLILHQSGEEQRDDILFLGIQL